MAKATTKKPNKKNDVFTVKDFKMWLLGMTEFQEPNWVPNSKQWKAIVDKIELLDDNVQYVQQAVSYENHPSPNYPNPPIPHQQSVVQQPHPFYNDNQGGAGGQAPAARFRDAGNEPPPERSSPRRTVGSGTGIVDIDITKSFI
jgi:hypothetical protein